jgi:hypothetical protein
MSEHQQATENEPLDNAVPVSFGSVLSTLSSKLDRFVNIAGLRGKGLY